MPSHLRVLEELQFLGDTFRAVYTVRFAGIIYVLHAFQKKSKKGSKTPIADIEKIRKRLKDAEEHYAQCQEDEKEDE